MSDISTALLVNGVYVNKFTALMFSVQHQIIHFQ